MRGEVVKYSDFSVGKEPGYEASNVYMCLYDLQKAFDTVEYFFLLERLYKAGVNGKMWRILKDWYEGGSARVGVNG